MAAEPQIRFTDDTGADIDELRAEAKQKKRQVDTDQEIAQLQAERHAARRGGQHAKVAMLTGHINALIDAQVDEEAAAEADAAALKAEHERLRIAHAVAKLVVAHATVESVLPIIERLSAHVAGVSQEMPALYDLMARMDHALSDAMPGADPNKETPYMNSWHTILGSIHTALLKAGLTSIRADTSGPTPEEAAQAWAANHKGALRLYAQRRGLPVPEAQP